jgi:hypothetical protein
MNLNNVLVYDPEEDRKSICTRIQFEYRRRRRTFLVSRERDSS